MANAALVAMRDPRRAIASLLTSQDGECAAGKDPAAHAATVGAHVTNDRVESNFGCVDMLMRMFRYSTAENISGMAQQMHNRDFERKPNIAHDRGRKRKADAEEAVRGGFYHTGLSPELQQSLVGFTRRAAEDSRADGRLALAAHDEEKLARREERVITMLNAAVEHYAYALELYDAWKAQRAKSSADIDAALTFEHRTNQGEPVLKAGKPLRLPRSEAEQLEYLRKQIEMRVLGLGWSQYATRWSSQKDERIGTVAHLRLLLEEIIVEEIVLEGKKKLPKEAAPPHHQARDLGQLGTADADAVEISARALFSADELRSKAEAARTRRVEAGIADTVESMQPHDAPAFDQVLPPRFPSIPLLPSATHPIPSPIPRPIPSHPPSHPGPGGQAT